MPKKVLFLIMCFVLAGIFKAFAQEGSQPEEISITTYYPSPYGSYGELRSKKIAVGGDYIYGSSYCWPPDTCTIPIDSNADLVVQGNVGIGTASPQGKLDLRGSLAVGGSVGTSGQVLQSRGPGMTPQWATTTSSCPVNYNDAGNYCISGARGLANWQNAAQSCRAEGAQLCSMAQLFPACTAGIIGKDGATNWTSDLYYDDGVGVKGVTMSTSGATCTINYAYALVNSLEYFCCYIK